MYKSTFSIHSEYEMFVSMSLHNHVIKQSLDSLKHKRNSLLDSDAIDIQQRCRQHKHLLLTFHQSKKGKSSPSSFFLVSITNMYSMDNSASYYYYFHSVFLSFSLYALYISSQKPCRQTSQKHKSFNKQQRQQHHHHDHHSNHHHIADTFLSYKLM